MPEGIQKVGAVLVALEDGFLFIAAAGDMVDSAAVLYTHGTGRKNDNIRSKEESRKMAGAIGAVGGMANEGPITVRFK
jgi:hypothetical protein